jgi:hypothetical protein
MTKSYSILVLLLISLSCKNNKDNSADYKLTTEEPQKLSLEQANILAELPLKCVQAKYPYHLVHVVNNKQDVQEPHLLYPAFHGCYDWHSAVHGHWSLVKLLKTFPGLKKAEIIRQTLKRNLSKENILKELEYFQNDQHKHFERTYGWAWLLKLAEELHTWEDDSSALMLKQNLLPLSNHIAEMYLDFLPKLKYPVRVGEHNNTAFGLCFAFDYAVNTKNDSLSQLIISKAKEFYIEDSNCPIKWEPGGYDFLSPCLEEIDLMRRVLPKDIFYQWVKDFLPGLKNQTINLLPGEVTDRTDGKLVHLDGLNFSRAWVLYGLAKQYPDFDFLIRTANEHINYSLPNLVDDSYEGGHWLGTFAIYALDN